MFARYLLLIASIALAGTAFAADLDGDGYDSVLDCNDHDADVHPSATEVCNGHDDNCNGTIDEEFDVDGDGVSTCTGDCDDADPAVHPGAAEVCDGIDNDCDARVDEGFDADGDGYSTCGETADCNDLDAGVSPDAEEVCNARDDNCDGMADENLDCEYMHAGEIDGLGDHGVMGGGCNCDAVPTRPSAGVLAVALLAVLVRFRRR